MTMTTVSSNGALMGQGLAWQWWCPDHEWSGPWDAYREGAKQGAEDHDVHYHGLVIEDDDD